MSTVDATKTNFEQHAIESKTIISFAGKTMNGSRLGKFIKNAMGQGIDPAAKPPVTTALREAAAVADAAAAEDGWDDRVQIDRKWQQVGPTLRIWAARIESARPNER
jgi:hypothetical protein